MAHMQSRRSRAAPAHRTGQKSLDSLRMIKSARRLRAWPRNRLVGRASWPGEDTGWDSTDIVRPAGHHRPGGMPAQWANRGREGRDPAPFPSPEIALHHRRDEETRRRTEDRPSWGNQEDGAIHRARRGGLARTREASPGGRNRPNAGLDRRIHRSMVLRGDPSDFRPAAAAPGRRRTGRDAAARRRCLLAAGSCRPVQDPAGPVRLTQMLHLARGLGVAEEAGGPNGKGGPAIE
jgi:hypothetical protein